MVSLGRGGIRGVSLNVVKLKVGTFWTLNYNKRLFPL